MKSLLMFSVLALCACTTQDSTPSMDTKPSTKSTANVEYQKPGASVDMKYEWLQKPVVGAPSKLKLEFQSGSGTPLTTSSITITADQNVQLSGNIKGGVLQVQKNNSGVMTQTIDVTTATEGLYYINVFVETENQGEKRSRAFAIPVQTGSSSKPSKHPTIVQQDGEPAVIELPAEKR